MWLTLLTAATESPIVSLQVGGGSGAPSAVRMILFLTVLSFAPAMILTMTCFTRFLIVFSFLRQALGVQGAPPAQVITGLALFLTAYVMAPIGQKVYDQGLSPYLDGKVTEKQAWDAGTPPLRDFMLRMTRDEDVALFYDIAKTPYPKTREEVSMSTLVPAFITSELRTGFQMGLMVLLPFLVIDLVVSAVLMSLGMAMLSPVLVSLPLKVLVFVAVDGWTLIVSSLAKGVA